ncbi:MAG: ATPase [Pseudomonadota bacterium]
MDDSLQRLLDAEVRAEQIARDAEERRDRTIREAEAEASKQEESLDERIPGLQKSWLERSEAKAAKTVAELERRYEERHTQLRDQVEGRENEALEAAFRILVDSTS